MALEKKILKNRPFVNARGQYNFDDRMRWFGGIKTKESKPNGRINTNIVIYKVFGS